MSERPATMSSSRSFLRRGRGRTAPVLALSAMAAPAPDAEFLARNAVDCLPSGELERKLAQGRPLRVKLGLDPTAPDVHLGHTVVLQKLREFQDLGHVVVLIVGDYTARVGDPSGRSSTAPAALGRGDRRERAHVRGAGLQGRSTPRRPRCASTPSGSTCPWRSSSASRARRPSRRSSSATTSPSASPRASPISVLELLYPLMQGYDSVAVRSDVELGGTDQKFNLLLGRDVQRAYGQPEQVALTMPILPGVDGERKMSKSLGNHIGVTEAPEEMYGKTMRMPGRRDGGLVPAAARRASRRPAPPRATPSTRSRAGSWSASTARRPPPRPRRTSTRVFVQRRPARGDRRGRASPARPGPPAGLHRRALRRLALGGAAAAVPGRGAPGRRAAGRRRARRPRGAPGRTRRAGRAAAVPPASASRRKRSADVEAFGGCAIFVAARPGGPAPAPQGARMVLVWSVRTAEPRRLCASTRGRTPPRAARRSLKTQQHAYLGSLEIRCASRFDPSGIRGANSQYSS